MMHMEHRLSQVQRQQLVLTQKMQQALHILQLSGLELDQHIQQELENNPFLEQVAPPEEALPVPAATVSVADADPNADEPFDLDAFDMRWREGRDLSINPDMDERRRYYEESITQEPSLRAHLLEQLKLISGDDVAYAIGERIIIGDIDDRGYFTGDTQEIANELGVPVELVEEVLAQIRRLEPTGIGARNVEDCLLMQIEANYPNEPQLKELVTKHLEALKRRQIPQIAKAMRITPERVEELKAMLSTLNPWPGHEFSSGPAPYITPDVVVEEVDDDFVVRLANDRLPLLRVNDDLSREFKRNGGVTREDKSYIKQKLESARWLTRNIAQRQNTILRVAQAIVDYQKEFMAKGVEYIRPLTLQVIADQLGVHESTVARTTRGKYIQTPQGLFELKYFFSPGLKRDTGEDQSSKSVQAAIKKLVDEEDKKRPLSDQKIAELLKKQGIHIARRTVTKYREQMGILATNLRKEFN